MKDILLIILGVLSTSFFISFLIAFRQLRHISDAFAKLLLITEATKRPKEGLDIVDDPNNIHKENFIKFLSESRDWAFEYIEEVQSGLSTFIHAVKPDIEYFDEYGEAGPVGPDHEALKRISKAYKELVNLMPDEDKQ